MHSGFQRFLTAGLAFVMSAAMLALPAVAVTEDSSLSDQNGDGVIDVFDYVLHKRATVAENSPLDFALSDTVAAPGGYAVISGSLGNNSGLSLLKFTVKYDEALSTVNFYGTDSPVAVNEALYPEADMMITEMAKFNRIFCISTSQAYTEENGLLFDIMFRLPEDAEIGTEYQIELTELEITEGSQKLPVLTKRGKITVAALEDLPEPPVTMPVTETETTTTTTTTTTTETTTLTTETETTTETEPETTAEETTPETTATTTEETTVETTTAVMPLNGIDISVYQGEIDFGKVKSDSDNAFVMMRAGFGKELYQEDIRFKANYNGAKSANIPVGAYWYSYATTPEFARIEANTCAQVLGSRKFEYPIAFDIEEPYVLDYMTPEQIGAIIDAFCSELESKGYYVMIYCSTFYFHNKVPAWVQQKYDIWLAHWNVAKPTYNGNYGIWQYGIGTCPGIEGDVDVDYSYRDYPAVMKEYHLNGY